MARIGVKDMTVGSPMKLVVGFALPLLFGLLFQQLYNFVDASIVGRTLGYDMLAAVGATAPLNFLILGFCNGMCSGFAIPIAQSFGAHDETELRRYVANAIYLCAGFSIVMGVLTAVFCPAMLRLMNTDESIIGGSIAYIQLIFAAIPVTVTYNMAGGILRSLGDSRTPVFFIAIASVVNIVLDLVFILVFHLGVRGAAIATIISQAVSAIGCIVVMVKRFPILHLTPDDRKLRPQLCVRLVGLGMPMGLQFSITAIGAVILQWSVNGISVEAVAAMSAGGKISALFSCMFDALSTTMATYAGQNMGARKIDRITEGLKATAIIGCIYCVCAYIIIWFAGRVMLGLFLDADAAETVISMAHFYLKINGAFYIPLLFVNIVRLSIQGMGFTRVAMIAGVLEMIARTTVALVLVPWLGFTGACFAHVSAWMLADVFLFPCYFSTIKKVRVRVNAQPV